VASKKPCSDTVSSTGCYCDEASRAHKWGLVLETIHYALATADPARIGDS